MLLLYALQFVGKPYIWGGEGPNGFDCSGLVQELLKAVGADLKGDQSSQALYDHFKYVGSYNERKLGALAFYGKDDKNITHVAMFLNDFNVIEAAGGDSTTLTSGDAEKRHAFVRVRPFNHRSDLVGIYKPKII